MLRIEKLVNQLSLRLSDCVPGCKFFDTTNGGDQQAVIRQMRGSIAQTHQTRRVRNLLWRRQRSSIVG